MQEIIREAVDAAGGAVAVAYHFKFKTESTVHQWIRAGRVPPYHVEKLCELGGGKVRPDQLRGETAHAA